MKDWFSVSELIQIENRIASSLTLVFLTVFVINLLAQFQVYYIFPHLCTLLSIFCYICNYNVTTYDVPTAIRSLISITWRPSFKLHNRWQANASSYTLNKIKIIVHKKTVRVNFFTLILMISVPDLVKEQLIPPMLSKKVNIWRV
jgi:hypothetical protein